MGRPKGSKNVKVEVPTAICTCCGKEKKMDTTHFYKSYSKIYSSTYENRMTICKECVWKLAEDFNERYSSRIKAIYELCKLLDIYYEKDIYVSALTQATNTKANPYKVYFQKVLSLPQYKGKTFEDSLPFDENEIIKETSIKLNDEEIIKRWGKGFGGFEDYQWLEEDYHEWITHVDSDKLSVQKLIQMICIKELEIRKARQLGKPTDKLEKALREAMADASLTPKTMSDMNKTDSQKTFGVWLKEIQNYRPTEYFEDKELYEDYDHIGEYFDRFVKRPLKNLLTGSRDFDKEYNIEDEEE